MAKPDQTADPNIAIRLIGTAPVAETTVPDIDGDGNDEDILCYTVDMEDLKTRKKIETATDCLSNIMPQDLDGDGVPDNISLDATTTFNFNDGNHLTSRCQTTVQPIVTEGSSEVTHITGSILSLIATTFCLELVNFMMLPYKLGFLVQ